MLLSNKQILNVGLALNIIILSFAYFIEYILKIPPCAMCNYQRIPYYIAIVIILLSYFQIINFKNTLIILIILISSNLILSFYHIGIEKGFFNELSTCANNVSANDVKNLLLELKKKTVISCKDISFTIFGLSLATINFVINIALIVFYWIILKNEK